MKAIFAFFVFISSTAIFAQSRSMQQAISTLKSGGYVEEATQIEAIETLSKYWDKPGVIEVLISLIYPQQSPQVIKTIVSCDDCYWGLAQIDGKRETVDQLVKLVSFKSFDDESAEGVHKKLSAEVRAFAISALGSFDYPDEALKRYVFDYFYNLLDEFQLDDFAKDHRLAALILTHLRRQKESSKLDFYLMNILENSSNSSIKNEALAVLRLRNMRFTSSAKLAVVHGLMSNKPRSLGKNVRVVRESDDSFSVRALEFLQIPIEPEYWSMPRNAPTDEGIIAMIETLFDRRIYKQESHALLAMRSELKTEQGDNRFEMDPETETESMLKFLEPMLERIRSAGVHDLNEKTGIAETRMLLETGILGIKVPIRWGLRSPTPCSSVLKDLGTTHLWEKI